MNTCEILPALILGWAATAVFLAVKAILHARKARKFLKEMEKIRNF